jgi:S1-C subfamily serine protease
MYFQEVASKNSNSHSYGNRVKLGVVPAFEDTGNKGMKISGVTENGPALKAGLMSGDIITGINNETINNIYDYMNRLQKLKPGQKITVQVNRNGEKLNFDVQL